MPIAEKKATHDSAVQAEIPQTGQVKDKRILPEGVVPKQAQAYVIAGLALLILLAVLFSKNHARTVPRETTPASSAVANNANQQRIQELEEDLNADQQRSQQQNARHSAQRAAATKTPDGAYSSSGSSVPQTPTPSQPRSPRNEIVNAEKELAFKALFASNLVAPASPAATTHTNTATNSADAVGEPDSTQVPPLQHASASQSRTANRGKHPNEVNIDSAHGRPYVIFEGTTIDTVLTNRLDGEFSGPVKVMVTNPVYSRDGQHVLVPAGTFVLGDAKKVGSMAQRRLAVTFHRMIMPDGYSVDLDQFRGLDQIGDTGLSGKIHHHYLEIFGTSIALGVISGAAESTTYGGYSVSGSDMYRQGVASSLSQSSGSVLDRFINIPPTITIPEGTRIRIYLTQDLLLPAYKNHDMPAVM